MTLIYESPIPGPATHALVIGVGYYHHLPGNINPRQPFTTVLVD